MKSRIVLSCLLAVSSSLFTGCGGRASSDVIALHPSNVVLKTRQVQGKISIEVNELESVRSVNVPVMAIDGKISPHKTLTWLRPPAALLKEYLNLKWEEFGGDVIFEQQSVNNLVINIQNCYLDKQINKFVFNVLARFNGKKITVKKKGADLVPLMIDAVGHIIDFMKVNMEKEPVVPVDPAITTLQPSGVVTDGVLVIQDKSTTTEADEGGNKPATEAQSEAQVDAKVDIKSAVVKPTDTKVEKEVVTQVKIAQPTNSSSL